MELECAGLKGGLESGNKLAAKDTAEHFDGQEEGSARGYPAGAIRSEGAGSDYAVDMRMKLQSLIPAMEHSKEADVGTEIARIAGSRAKFRRRRETAACIRLACSVARAERVRAAA